jgi:hypothetical protein
VDSFSLSLDFLVGAFVGWRADGREGRMSRGQIGVVKFASDAAYW